MEWDAKDRDDIMHALRQVLEFFGKTPSDSDMKMWVAGVRHRSPERIKAALRKHLEVGTVAPKPGHINRLIDEDPHRAPVSNLPPPSTDGPACDPKIAQAWMWYIQQRAGGLITFNVGEISVETQDEYLHIVNKQAAANGNPDAIADEHKLEGYW